MSKVHFVSLGCPKNRVDAEHMLGLALGAGHEVTDQADSSDVIVVNTCAFIGEAKKESIQAVLEMAEVKAKGGQQLIMTGCMAQRYHEELRDELPEVDHFLGTSDYHAINRLIDPQAAVAESALEADGELIPLSSLTRRDNVTDDLSFVAGCDMPRENSMPRYTAYLKIAEGCDNKCAFCIIPKLRGKQRSRPIEDLVREAYVLAREGVKELNLIAQDLTGYGHDLDGRPTLAALLEALGAIPGLRWVRLMYAYPRSLSDDLLAQMASGSSILPYLDIPVQHGSDRMLKLMKRGRDQKRLASLLAKVREKVPSVVLRSTVIVGFPGETDDDFQKLLDFAAETRFERLGVFKYSDEEDTAAYDLEDKVSYKTKRARFDKLMRRQRKIHKAYGKSMIGEVHDAIVEGQSDEHEFLVVGRLWSQAPEIDGITYLSSPEPLNIGDIVPVRITDAHDYDLVAEVLDQDDPDHKNAMPFGAA